MNKRTIVFFDGDCALCNAFLRYLGGQDLPDHVYFASQHSHLFESLQEEFHFLQQVDSVVVCTEHDNYKSIEIKSEAVQSLSAFCSMPFALFQYTKFLPTRFSDSIYNLVAENRHKFWSNKMCTVFDERVRKRLIS